MVESDRWLGLARLGSGHWEFELTPELARFDNKLYGGTGLAVATAAMEAESGRDALWATVQFVASADVGERLDFHVEVLAEGRRTSQVRITATVGERLVLAGLGATGLPRDGGVEAQIATMPDVAPPEDSPLWLPRMPFNLALGHRGWLDTADLREVPGSRDGLLMWARIKDQPMSRSGLGFIGDMVPSAVVRAAGRAGGGTSLDNSIRFGPAPTTDWVLLDLDPYFALGGYVHGAARLWGSDGVQLAVATQTAVALTFD